MSTYTHSIVLEAARAAMAAGDFRHAAELYAAIQVDDESRP
jgi:hypothetical protein